MYTFSGGVDMQSSLISKIEKAKRYAQQPERINILDFEATFSGENSTHRISCRDGKWSCTCDFFTQWGHCSHTMALQRLLGPMLPAEARSSPMSD